MIESEGWSVLFFLVFFGVCWKTVDGVNRKGKRFLGRLNFRLANATMNNQTVERILVLCVDVPVRDISISWSVKSGTCGCC